MFKYIKPILFAFTFLIALGTLPSAKETTECEKPPGIEKASDVKDPVVINAQEFAALPVVQKMEIVSPELSKKDPVADCVYAVPDVAPQSTGSSDLPPPELSTEITYAVYLQNKPPDNKPETARWKDTHRRCYI